MGNCISAQNEGVEQKANLKCEAAHTAVIPTENMGVQTQKHDVASFRIPPLSPFKSAQSPFFLAISSPTCTAEIAPSLLSQPSITITNSQSNDSARSTLTKVIQPLTPGSHRPSTPIPADVTRRRSSVFPPPLALPLAADENTKHAPLAPRNVPGRRTRSASVPHITPILTGFETSSKQNKESEEHTEEMMNQPQINSRRKSIPNLLLRPFEPMKSVKGDSRRRRANECSPLSPYAGQPSPLIRAASAMPAGRRLFDMEQFLTSNTFSIPLGSIFDDYCMSAEKLKYVQIFHLCSDLVDNFIISYRTRVIFELESKQLIASDARIENQLNRDLPYLLGDGECVNSKSVWVELAAKKMWKCLDFNGEGTVSKTKFIARFQKACQQIINIQQLKAKRSLPLG